MFGSTWSPLWLLSHATNKIRICLDPFVISLVSVVLAATFFPCDGTSAHVLSFAGMGAISALFFLQGARLPREAIANGLTHWRLHLMTTSTTFLIFPLLGLLLAALLPGLLPGFLWVGVLFACTLPSTIQSSIALTSIAEGNVAGAVCAATVSNVVGIVLSPLLFSTISRLHGGGINIVGVWQIILQLLMPFAAGHLLRQWIGNWVERSRSVLMITDRSSILLVVYTAFSAAVVHGIWHQLPLRLMGLLCLIVALLLAIGLLVTVLGSRALGLSRADEVAAVFCGSQKSLVTGVPMANVLFGSASVGPLLLPIMIYYPSQLLVCAWLARWYAHSQKITRLAGSAVVGLAVGPGINDGQQEALTIRGIER